MSSQSSGQLITVKLQYNGIKIKKQCSDVSYVESVHIRGLSGPHHMLSEYGDLLLSLHSQFKCGKKFAPEKNSEHGCFPHSCKILWFISLNLFLCLHLEICSFLWFRRLFPWRSMINSFSSKHK